jgi:hypothetical protein
VHPPLAAAVDFTGTTVFEEEDTMTDISLVVGVFVLATGVLQQSPPVGAPASGHLRWVHATVAQTTPASVTLQLRDKTLTVALDPGARILPVGSLVEVHYLEKPAPRAVLILDRLPPETVVSKRAGRSYRGVISRTKSQSVYLRVDNKNREVKMYSKTRLTGADGRVLVTGSKTVAAQMSVGEEVLINYDQQSEDMMAGDLLIPGSSDRALVIRKLGASATGEGAIR